MIRPILKYGDSLLHEPAAPIDAITLEIERLVDDMIDTMYAAPGIGLAAPQIGVDQRVCVIDISAGRAPKGLVWVMTPPSARRRARSRSARRRADRGGRRAARARVTGRNRSSRRPVVRGPAAGD